MSLQIPQEHLAQPSDSGRHDGLWSRIRRPVLGTIGAVAVIVPVCTAVTLYVLVSYLSASLGTGLDGLPAPSVGEQISFHLVPGLFGILISTVLYGLLLRSLRAPRPFWTAALMSTVAMALFLALFHLLQHVAVGVGLWAFNTSFLGLAVVFPAGTFLVLRWRMPDARRGAPAAAEPWDSPASPGGA